jgi:pSer/pThr/pTyr-binding forkhead associated (FHA) protein
MPAPGFAPGPPPPPPPPQAAYAGAPPPIPSMGNGQRLVLYYRGQRHEVNKDRFIIGRGKQSSDLTIKDPNVSRQHAMIECLNGQYFMVDMGSTNGIEFNGQRLQRKPIASGDVFNICDHELRFVFE